MYRKLNLGKAANAYTKEVMEQGNELSKALLNSLDIENGHVATFIPEATPKEKLEAFSSGGVATRDVTLTYLTQFMHGFLQASEDHCLIFEEFSASLTDPWLKVKEPSYVHVGNELYYFLSGKNITKEDITKHIKIAESYRFAVAMTALPKSKHPKLKSEVSTSIFQEAANNTCFIAVNAYDHEGFLIWQRAT